jgi:predicted nucleic acid-binding protein
MVVGEIVHGIRSLPAGRKRSDLEQKFQRLGIGCLPVPVNAAEHYAGLRIECRQQGIAVGENDFWIAATALALGAVLVTRDRDFTQISSLRVADWTV